MSIPTLSDWLSNTRSSSSDQKYEHLLLEEDAATRDTFMDTAKAYVQAAHEDAKNHLRELFDVSLDPLAEDIIDVSVFYPGWFNILTLKGYFGEVMASLVAIHYAPFELTWHIPVHLFRYHNTAMEKMFSLYQTISETPDNSRPHIPGRTGDDCLAFEISDERKITKMLYGEAKCTSSHDTSLINKAYERLPQSYITGIWQMKDALENNASKDLWIEALTELSLSIRKRTSQVERIDHFVYVCAEKPKRSKTWISQTTSHASYTAKRRLSVAEIHLCDVESTINYVYETEQPVQYIAMTSPMEIRL
jgi:hypothetical protein